MWCLKVNVDQALNGLGYVVQSGSFPIIAGLKRPTPDMAHSSLGCFPTN